MSPRRPLTTQQTLQTPNRSVRVLKTSSGCKLPDLPADILVMIFEALPRYFRIDVAKTCKQLAQTAKSYGLLVCNPAVTTLLQHLTESSLRRKQVYKVEDATGFPMRFSKDNTLCCGYCSYRGMPGNIDCMKHVLFEAKKEKIRLTKGMVWHLSYEFIRLKLTRLSFGFARQERFQDVIDEAELEEDMQDALQHHVKDMNRVIRDILKRQSYEYLRWEVSAGKGEMNEWVAALARKDP